jgi:heme a synthase
MVNKWIKWWLFTGLVMLFVQVIVGGITRLTESGLSITKWEIVSGTLPPLTESAWVEEFNLYKTTPQYIEINEGMSMSDFKFIYFWEWVHRFWARIMGFVFIIPFTFFYFKKWFKGSTLLRDLGVVFLLALLAASFGWIMVASGLVKRPWVNAYKLSLHLCIAFSVFAYLLWTYLKYINMPHSPIYKNKITFIFLVVLWLQLFLGGVMSGMKAAVYFPTWPTMNGEIVPSFIFNISEWSYEKFNNYDAYELLPALVQLFHRLTGYTLFILGTYLSYILYKNNRNKINMRYLCYFFVMLISQVILGIITVLLSKGEVPVLWGVLHQGGALLLLTSVLVLRFEVKSKALN